ncbi:MAG: dTDP-glucose 4,6-dehydratase [archaeon]|nr:dTDP-glucose 4,6-dehydratase [archaeon]
METVLVTGGAGFIGSNFVKFLLANNPKISIINLDKLTYAGNIQNLREVKNNPRHIFLRGDICDKKTVEKAMKKCGTVFNFAAESHVDKSIQNASDFIKTNIFGTFVLLEAARKNKVNNFVQISTDEVYGSIKKGKAVEKQPLNPSNPYSASKASAELIALSYFKTHNLPVKITRSSNNFGPHQFPEKIIPLFATNILEGKKAEVYGSGLNSRDWLFAEDNCKGIFLAASKGKNGEVYNIGGGNEVKNIDLAKKIVKLLGKTREDITFVKDRPGHDFRYALDSSKIKKLGFFPSKNFEKNLAATIEWYKQNEWWWKPLKGKKGAF